MSEPQPYFVRFTTSGKVDEIPGARLFCTRGLKGGLCYSGTVKGCNPDDVFQRIAKHFNGVTVMKCYPTDAVGSSRTPRRRPLGAEERGARAWRLYDVIEKAARTLKDEQYRNTNTAMRALCGARSDELARRASRLAYFADRMDAKAA